MKKEAVVEKVVVSARILPCKCDHAFQDRRYGRGMRVHTPVTKEGKKDGHGTGSCTVCGTKHNF